MTLRLVRDEIASRNVPGLIAIKLVEEAPAGSVVVATLDGDKAFAADEDGIAVTPQDRYPEVAVVAKRRSSE